MVWTQIEPKLLVPWHWYSVNEAIMSLPKDVSNNFPLKRYGKNCFRPENYYFYQGRYILNDFVSTQPVIFM